MRRLLLCVLVRLLHDCPGRASAAASSIMSRRRAEVDAVAATRPSSQATSTRFPRPARSSTTAPRRPANLEQRSRALPH